MRAIVIGASVAGLVAARVLADYAESVSIVERDVLPDTATARKGVPQGRHVHGLLAGGLDTLRKLFPGILDDLVAEGSSVADVGQDVLWFNNGAWRLRCKCGVTGCIQTRPLLELHIRRRVAGLLNVKLLCRHAVTGLEINSIKTRVTGVRVAPEGQGEEILPADMVVDCSGRGSKLPIWLEASALGKPPKTEITVNVGYSTQYFRLPSRTDLGWLAMLVLNRPPKITRLGAGFLVEGGELQLTLGGLFRDYPPDDEAGFLEFAESLEHPGLFHAIRGTTPSSDIMTYGFPAHVWHHYDRMKNVPENLLVMGDALCSFNPVYGQGMTVAAKEAQVLQRCLAEANRSERDIRKLRGRYFQGVGGIVKAAWAMATGADLAFPQAEAPRPFAHGAVNRYFEHVLGLSCYDRKVLTVWNQVTNMQRPLSALFTPSILGRVMKRAVAGGPTLNTQQP